MSNYTAGEINSAITSNMLTSTMPGHLDTRVMDTVSESLSICLLQSETCLSAQWEMRAHPWVCKTEEEKKGKKWDKGIQRSLSYDHWGTVGNGPLMLLTSAGNKKQQQQQQWQQQSLSSHKQFSRPQGLSIQTAPVMVAASLHKESFFFPSITVIDLNCAVPAINTLNNMINANG